MTGTSGREGSEPIDGIDELLAELNAGHTIEGGSPLHLAMHAASQAALRIAAELAGTYHEPDQVRALLSRLSGRTVPESLVVFPPFQADFGRNITFGENVFVNAGARFQDQGGITIGDGALIGHNATITTLHHDLDPARRADMHPAPVRIGRGAWLGSNVTVLPGVTIGDGAVVGAGSLVTKDVPPYAVVVGVPARQVRSVPGAEAHLG